MATTPSSKLPDSTWNTLDILVRRSPVKGTINRRGRMTCDGLHTNSLKALSSRGLVDLDIGDTDERGIASVTCTITAEGRRVHQEESVYA